jgi:hypothetical protein
MNRGIFFTLAAQATPEPPAWRCAMRTNFFGLAGLAAGLLLSLPAAAWAQGLGLKPGWVYVIAFPDSGANGANANGGNPQGNNPPPASVAPLGKTVALYKIVGASDQNWYRVRMITRTPQGTLAPLPNTSELWINLNYAMWVQEVLR